MATYILTKDGFVDKTTGSPMEIPERDGVCMPLVSGDIEPYRSPIDGKVIGSRTAQREDLAKHGCVLKPPRKSKGYSNPDWAIKRGLPLSEKAQDTHKLTNKHVKT